MYFDKFPSIYYDFKYEKNDVRLQTVKDITFNVRLRREILSNVTLFETYDMKEGETPESVSEKVYGSPHYHWAIMLANDKYDYIEDFPKTTFALEKFIDAKYGLKKNDPHHYIKDGEIVDQFTIGATAVSNYDHEYQENDKKRTIKLISRNLLTSLVSNLEKYLQPGSTF